VGIRITDTIEMPLDGHGLSGQSASLRSQTLQMRKAPSIICGSLDDGVLRAKNSRLPMNRE